MSSLWNRFYAKNMWKNTWSFCWNTCKRQGLTNLQWQKKWSPRGLRPRENRPIMPTTYKKELVKKFTSHKNDTQTLLDAKSNPSRLAASEKWDLKQIVTKNPKWNPWKKIANFLSKWNPLRNSFLRQKKSSKPLRPSRKGETTLKNNLLTSKALAI